MRWAVVALAGCMAVAPATALDEIVLKNGRRYMGTIVRDTPEAIVVSIDGGSVEFPRSAVASPPFHGPKTPDAAGDQTANASSGRAEEEIHPIPSIATALRRLRRFEWVTGVRQVPAIVTDHGRWQFMPCVSFWAADFAQINFYGDPERPAAVEVSLLDPPPDAWEKKRSLLEYVLNLAPTLALDDRFDRLNVYRDSFVVEDLWLGVTSPDSQESPGRWTVLLLHERSLSPSRASFEELQTISEPLKDATLDPEQPRSWQRGSWTVEDVEWLRRSLSLGRGTGGEVAVEPQNRWTALGGERVFVRSFHRDRGKYARSSTDWLREVAANSPTS